MLQIGLGEVIVVFLIALLVLEPKQLLAIARLCGHWLSRTRRTYQEIKNQLQQELQKKSSD